MKINDILTEAPAKKTITLPVAVQVYDEENDVMTKYSVPMSFNTRDISDALYYLLSGGSTGDSALGFGGLDDTLLAAEIMGRYKEAYHQKARKIYDRLGMDY